MALIAKIVLPALCVLFHLQLAMANVAGTDLQNFNPLTNGLDFVTVHSSRTLEPGQLSLGGFMNYAQNSLPYSTLSTQSNLQSLTDPNDQLLYSNLNAAFGIIDGWDFGIATGFITAQSIQQPNFLFSYGNKGINETRLHTKVRAYKTENLGLAFWGGVDFEHITDNPFAGENPGPTFNIGTAFDFNIAPDLLWAVNLGYRVRIPGSSIPNFGVIPLGDQVIYSTALSYQTDQQGSAIIAELYGSVLTEQTTIPSDRELSNLEALVGYRWQGLEDIDLHGGFGSAFFYGLGSPDFRAYLGVNWRVQVL